jgi:single-strand DNA-binding protein
MGGFFFHKFITTHIMLNTTTIIGHIGQDATTKTLQGGRVVTNFSVAHSETWTDAAGERQQRTTWFNCAYFTQQQPGVAAYLLRGALVCIIGKVSARAYLDARNQPAASLDLNVQEIRLLGSSKREENNAPAPGAPNAVPPPPAKQPETFTPAAPHSGDDLPF